MLARTRDGTSFTAPYPEYGRGSLVARSRRCVFCVDATGELADFSCGDAWVDRFVQGDENPWSIVLARSERAEDIVSRMVQAGRLAAAEVSADEVVYSQRFNLDSKLARQRKRMAICRLLFQAMPDWEVDLPKGGGSYLREIRVLMNKAQNRLKYRFRYGLGLRTKPERAEAHDAGS
jgi:coenzyme F420 hydrogenase subunit beta